MFIITASRLLSKNFNGLTIFPFIILKEAGLKSDKTLLNHEKIHIRQQIELLWLPFFIWYGVEFLVRWIQFKNKQEAYRNISFEREAYACENDLQYLNKRKLWGFWKYLFDN
ncbi:MAG TPA: hypothetical protein VK021_05455 [Flavobacteriaceae bacterium]|nr:hypothetical protein [Flavobacteriaceae bacterium]